jgi:hypothetical protein
MTMNLSEKFLTRIAAMSKAELDAEIISPSKLLIETWEGLSVVYAPFDHINSSAKVVIVGMTPGRQQMGDALREARRLLLAGNTPAAALAGTKVFASFSGALRSNLVAMLDYAGLNEKLALKTTGSLWENNDSLVHFTSALRYPVFLNQQNYSGSPDMVGTPFLRQHLEKWLIDEMRLLPHAVFVPLGPKVALAVKEAARWAGISTARVLDGMPHPSGANAERIAFFLDRKPKALLSSKVNPKVIIEARSKLMSKIALTAL